MEMDASVVNRGCRKWPPEERAHTHIHGTGKLVRSRLLKGSRAGAVAVNTKWDLGMSLS